jgi:Domain of unknown function (DUF4157)
MPGPAPEAATGAEPAGRRQATQEPHAESGQPASEVEAGTRRAGWQPASPDQSAESREAEQAEGGGERETAQEQPHLVDDSMETVLPGQMRKAEFFAELRRSIEETAEAALAGTGRTAQDCPYITYWLAFYERQPAAMIEPALRRYAPEAARDATARAHIGLIARRVSRAVSIWASSGRITGVPEGVPRQIPPEMATQDPILRKSRDGAGAPPHDAGQVRGELGAGQPLEGGVRTRMEGAFGHDFSAVRVHTGAHAASMSDRLGARAFTVGTNVAFAAGEYKPGSLVGDALLAHELAHVVQQGSSGGPAAEETALERDADASAASVLSRLWSGATQRCRRCDPVSAFHAAKTRKRRLPRSRLARKPPRPQVRPPSRLRRSTPRTHRPR